MTDLVLRSATDSAEDVGFMRSMLYEAAHWRPGEPRPPLKDALASPQVRVYLDGWGRPGDGGMVAEAGAERLGAAWRRVFGEDEHGYGFVDAGTPELTIAVAAPRRGMGVGGALLAALLAQARLDGVTALSLSVEDDNPAKRLYERFGFRSVARTGDAHTMLARLTSGA